MANTEFESCTDNTKINKLKPAFDELTQFFLDNGIKYNEVLEAIKASFIDSARKSTSGKMNASSISLKTGIDRRQIPKATDLIKNKLFSNNNKPDPIVLVLADLRRYQERTNSSIIKIHGSCHSLSDFCGDHKGRIPIPTIINELESLDCIKRISKNEAQIINTTIRSVQSDENKFNYASDQLYKLINTLRTNIEDPDNSVVQWSISSTKINSENQKQLSNDVDKVRNYLRPHILNVIEQYESLVPRGTFDEFSLNFFINSKTKAQK